MTINEMVSLGLIYSQPCHTYALDTFIKVVKLDQWANISRASLYNTLKRLEAEGCVSAETEKVGNMPERKVYAITEKGKQRLLKVLRKNIMLPQINGNNFALAMLFCFGMPASEAIDLLGKRIEVLNKEIEKLRIDYREAEKYHVHNWMIFNNAGIKHMELEIETAREFIKLLQDVPDYFDKNVSERYRYKIQHAKKQ